MQLTFDYLKHLDKPQEAITNELWRSWTREVFQKTSPEAKKMSLRHFALNIKFIPWMTKTSSDTVFDVLGYSIEQIKENRASDWWRKAVVLIIKKLEEMDSHDIEEIANKKELSEKDLKDLEKEEDYNRARIDITHKLNEIKKDLSDENFEERFSNFLKTILGQMFSVIDYRTKNKDIWIKVLYYRIHGMMKFEEISEKLDIYNAQVNNIINTITSDFKTKILDNDKQKINNFHNKMEDFYDKAFEVLDTSDLDKRNTRLRRIKFFNKYFLNVEII